MYIAVHCYRRERERARAHPVLLKRCANSFSILPWYHGGERARVFKRPLEGKILVLVSPSLLPCVAERGLNDTGDSGRRYFLPVLSSSYIKTEEEEESLAKQSLAKIVY